MRRCYYLVRRHNSRSLWYRKARGLGWGETRTNRRSGGFAHFSGMSAKRQRNLYLSHRLSPILHVALTFLFSVICKTLVCLLPSIPVLAWTDWPPVNFVTHACRRPRAVRDDVSTSSSKPEEEYVGNCVLRGPEVIRQAARAAFADFSPSSFSRSEQAPLYLLVYIEHFLNYVLHVREIWRFHHQHNTGSVTDSSSAALLWPHLFCILAALCLSFWMRIARECSRSPSDACSPVTVFLRSWRNPRRYGDGGAR